jgi:hypothetical protein
MQKRPYMLPFLPFFMYRTMCIYIHPTTLFLSQNSNCKFAKEHSRKNYLSCILTAIPFSKIVYYFSLSFHSFKQNTHSQRHPFVSSFASLSRILRSIPNSLSQSQILKPSPDAHTALFFAFMTSHPRNPSLSTFLLCHSPLLQPTIILSLLRLTRYNLLSHSQAFTFLSHSLNYPT